MTSTIRRLSINFYTIRLIIRTYLKIKEGNGNKDNELTTTKNEFLQKSVARLGKKIKNKYKKSKKIYLICINTNILHKTRFASAMRGMERKNEKIHKAFRNTALVINKKKKVYNKNLENQRVKRVRRMKFVIE